VFATSCDGNVPRHPTPCAWRGAAPYWRCLRCGASGVCTKTCGPILSARLSPLGGARESAREGWGYLLVGGLMNWIRVAVTIADDPDIHALAEGLGVKVAEAIGLVVSVLCKCPAHVPDGKFRDIPASLVEKWAGWEGERGTFDREF